MIFDIIVCILVFTFILWVIVLYSNPRKRSSARLTYSKIVMTLDAVKACQEMLSEVLRQESSSPTDKPNRH